MFRSLFREKVAGFERVPSNIVAPRSPERDWSPRLDIPGVECPSSAPECQEGAGEAPPAPGVRLVMLAIKGCGRSIFLTDRMGVGGIPKSLDIGCAHLRRKHGRGRAPAPERIVDDGVRCRRQDALRKRCRLSQ
jgi:hypothetical protein